MKKKFREFVDVVELYFVLSGVLVIFNHISKTAVMSIDWLSYIILTLWVVTLFASIFYTFKLIYLLYRYRWSPARKKEDFWNDSEESKNEDEDEN